MADSDEPLLETCHACAALIDISDAEPLALLHCPACGAGMRVRKTFDNFELQEVLGAGGMGAVYRAYDRNLNRSVALKLLRREYGEDEEFVAQFQNEASITASINHPNVVKVFSAGNDHGRIYIAMELVDKGSLDDLMTLQGRVAEAQVLEVGIQIAEGLNAALQRGLIHRDIKPGNILFSDAHTAKIVDFGLAVLQEHAGKVKGEVWGTPYYVAPEKLDNQPEDFRSDMYSLGATLFHAVAGRPPFEAETASMVALKHVKSQVVSLQAFAPDVSSPTTFVINKALHKDPDQRYQSYGELVEHLKYARTELLNRARKPTPRARIALEREKEQRVMSWFTFSMVALVVLGGVLAFTMRDRLFGPSKNANAQLQEMTRRIQELQPAYNDARAELIRKDFRGATRSFQSLAADPTTPQPLLNWFNLHAGLAMLFNDDLNGARQEFARIEDRKMFSQEPAERRLARFFLDLSSAVRAEGDGPNIKPTDFDPSNYESIGPLVLGLKAWNESKIDQAGVLLNQFKASTPQPPYEWIVKYKGLLEPYYHDLRLYRQVTEALKGETPEERKAALETLRDARSKLTLKGGILARVEELMKQTEAETSKMAAEQGKMQGEMEASDAPKIADLKEQVHKLLLEFKLDEAAKALADTELESEKGKADKAALEQQVEWMIRLRQNLVADLEKVESKLAVERKSGQPVPQGRVKATSERVEIWLPQGRLPIPWDDVKSESIFALAKSQFENEIPPDDLADRKWDLGIYAMILGRDEESRELTNDAVVLKGTYQEKIPVLEKLRGG